MIRLRFADYHGNWLNSGISVADKLKRVVNCKKHAVWRKNEQKQHELQMMSGIVNKSVSVGFDCSKMQSSLGCSHRKTGTKRKCCG